MIAGSFLLLVIPLAMAGIVYILLRWETLSALLAVGTATALGVAVGVLPLDQPVRFGRGPEVVLGEAVNLFGRELVLEQSDRIAMAFLFFTAAGIFLLAWRAAPKSLLFPMGLGLLSLLNGALLVRPFIYAILLIEIAAAFTVFALQVENAPPTRGGLRYLTFTVLALPGMLVAHWLLDRYAIMPDRTELLTISATLLTFSFALLLGVVPFHSWVTAVASDSVPLAGAFVFTVSVGANWFLLFDFLETYPWLSEYPQFGSLTLFAGLAMIVFGGVLAPSQRRLGPLLGLAALVDGGATLIALGLGNKLGITLSILSLLIRPFGLVLMAAGLSHLKSRHSGMDNLAALRGDGWKLPWSTGMLIVGSLSAIGLPVSPGFVWRWALYRALMPSNPGAVILLFLAGLGLLAGLWRWAIVLMERPRLPENRSVISLRGRSVEGWVSAGVSILAISFNVVVGIFPRSLALLAAQLADVYTFFAP